jgi:hypothetical protein
MGFLNRQFFQRNLMARAASDFAIAFSNRIAPTEPALRRLPGGQSLRARHALTSCAGIPA